MMPAINYTGFRRQMRILKGHPEYDEQTYNACGRVYRAEGWSEVDFLFSFRGPRFWKTDEAGLLRLANALRTRRGYPAHGDEEITHIA